MKRTWMIAAVVFLAVFTLPQTHSAEPGQMEGVQSGEKDGTVTVYYFHGARRCQTCLSIERVARGVVKDRYGDDKRVVFRSVDIEEEKNEKLATEYEIASSALLVCRGKKKADLTTDAFQYARSNPEKLQKKLIAAIDRQLK